MISLAVYVPISRPDTIYVPCTASLWNGYRTGPASGFQFHSLSNHLITKIFASNPPDRKPGQTAITVQPEGAGSRIIGPVRVVGGGSLVSGEQYLSGAQQIVRA